MNYEFGNSYNYDGMVRLMQIDFYLKKIRGYSNINDQIFDIVQNSFTGTEQFVINRKVQWIYINNTSAHLPSQGWKIHLSATYISAVDVLQRVIKIVQEEKLSFKVADTLNTLKVMNDAHYPMGYSGKFITIYPENLEQFKRVIDKLHLCTIGLKGPAILSDKQYKDGIVYYRYGEIRGINVNAKDNKRYIYDENNNLFEDQRNAWFSPPNWVTDPFKDDDPNNKSNMRIMLPQHSIDLQYTIRHANKGGVYVAKDENNTRLILKEARKYVATDSLGYDVSDYLKNEYNILTILKGKDYVPQVFKFLETSKSSYILEEYIDGQTLAEYINSTHKAFDFVNDIHRLLFISMRITESVMDMHKQGIIIRDLTKNNIIVTDELNVLFIDFNISFNSRDRLYAPNSGTEGYFYKGRNNMTAINADDVFSLGCVLYFIFSNRDPLFFDTENQSVYSQQVNYLRVVGTAKHIPSALINIILDLINPELYNKIELNNVYNSLNDLFKIKVECNHNLSVKKFSGIDLLKDISSYISNMIDFSGKRILPVSKNGERMSPSCIQTGSSGVGQLLIKLTQMGFIHTSLLKNLVRWTKENWFYKYDDSETTVNDLSLYFGVTGVLWFLLDAAEYLEDANLFAEVQDLFISNIEPSKIYNDIVLGNAGYGMAAIHFYKKTNQIKFLDIAKNMGDTICENMLSDHGMLIWPLNNDVFWGYAHGHAGICHFLNVLFSVTKENKYIDIANRICDTLISNAIIKNNCASWNFGPNNTKSWSHWCNGSSGIGSMFIRMYITTKNENYLKYAKYAAKDVYNNIWKSSMCQCHGACGDAEFLYDLYLISNESEYLSYIDNVNEYIFSSRVNYNNLYLFTDETRMAISADWGTGLSGVGTYIVRFISKNKERLFMNDDILLD